MDAPRDGSIVRDAGGVAVASRRVLTVLTACSVVAVISLRASGVATASVAREIELVAAGMVALRVLATLGLAAAGRVRWTRLPVMLLVGVEAILYVLRIEHDAYLGRGAIIGFECLVIAYAITAATRDAARHAGGELEERLEPILERVFPGVLARVVAGECAVVRSVFARARDRAPADTVRSFGYMAESSLKLFVLACPLLLIGDVLVVHALLPARWLAAHVVVTALSVYGCVWLIGLYRTMTLRPHTLDAVAFHAKKGILGSISIPRADIASAIPLGDLVAPPKGTERRATRLDVAGSPRILLSLRSAVGGKGFFRPLAPSDRIVVSADDPSALCEALKST